MEELHTLKCKACEGLEDKLTDEAIQNYLHMVTDWKTVDDGTKIVKEIAFKNFNEVIAFVNKIAHIAEEEGHHPDMFIYSWNKLRISLSTFALHALSINDFILASKIDQLLKPTQQDS